MIASSASSNEHSFANNSSAAANGGSSRFFKQIDEKHINQEISQMLWVNNSCPVG